MFGWLKIGKGKSTKAKKEGFFYDKNGVFKKGVLPEKYYYNDKLGAMVEGVQGRPYDPGSELRPGVTLGKAGHSTFSDPFSKDGYTYGEGGKIVPNVSNKEYMQSLLDNGLWGELAAAALTEENRSK
jgi:hypothetical protein